MTEGKVDELVAEIPAHAKDARADTGVKHFAWTLPGNPRALRRHVRDLGRGLILLAEATPAGMV